jgi:hypothetical protein
MTDSHDWMSTRSLRLLACVLWLSLACGGPARPAEAASGSPLGINLFKIRHYSPELTFVDIARRGGRWMVRPRGSEPVLDDEGWIRSLAPGQVAEMPLLTGWKNVPEGVYTARWEGQGEVEIRGAQVLSQGPGQATFRFETDAKQRTFRIVRTEPSDPIRRVQILLPGYGDGGTTFHPRFLERWRGFRVLRFMDWMETNDSGVSSWADRPLPNGLQGTERGVAIEHMIALANELGADPWLCIPHRADDDYVRQLARLVGARLAPGLRVWVEYSNEVWNGQFDQAEYVRQQGVALGLAPPAQEYKAGLRFTARRSSEIFRLFQAELGGRERLVRILPGQHASPDRFRELLGFEGAHEHADAYAIAPYFGGRLARKEGPRLLAAGQDALWPELERDIDFQADLMRQNAEMAREHGLALVAYEGGQHLRGSPRDEALTEFLVSANRHARMGQLYARYLSAWRAAGGHTFVHFSSMSGYSKTGSWGALETFSQDAASAPKYGALLEFARGNPRWWGGGP